MQPFNASILLLNLLATFSLTGIIWLIQVLHYPFLRFADPARFQDAHNFHVRAITPVVAPLMIIELVAAMLFVFFPPNDTPLLLPVAGMCLVAIVWLSTFLIQVPLHNSISKDFDAAIHRRFVAGNWIRTACWTARSAILGYVAFRVFVGRL
ncbi:MAG: hypothetical protein DWQ47_06585 [Acidobacteria bacterium]|nr:MAG: hypothetical protein DWQ32_10135 [Acidobacteriota bacterium]REK02040.1 MAG: hypothetical protein DWQ38_06565 [Acidobacteriota bacterium]REK14998.1 MAG: hypothetical protein DWQ43_15825 [Acidobacteriota bacterium]REK45712.1 MAG: hypothetical protein DWQ47_06585 [Acidobacteriota bacterium]